ncbi:33k protein [Deer mastadenovirus B]|uniref:33k protein n=1 Tax=Deer mastadenovirus B TaxID=2170000 RepID=A0A1Y0B6G8_9ADEN|nr:33k protein [Deer mastadenovirus B]ART33376.1 33k protein [Deer mastadenovirus B]
MKPRAMPANSSAPVISEQQIESLNKRGRRRKSMPALIPTAVLEDISEGEEDSPLTEEEDGETLDSDFSDFTDDDAEEEAMISIPRAQGPSSELEEGEIPTAVAKQGQGKKTRWDQQVRSSAAAKGMKGKKNYGSWKPFKPTILSCLLQSSGNTAFARRYLLFHHGVSIPSRVIRYYNSYCRPEGDQGRRPEQKEPPWGAFGESHPPPSGISAIPKSATSRRCKPRRL